MTCFNLMPITLVVLLYMRLAQSVCIPFQARLRLMKIYISMFVAKLKAWYPKMEPKNPWVRLFIRCGSTFP